MKYAAASSSPVNRSGASRTTAPGWAIGPRVPAAPSPVPRPATRAVAPSELPQLVDRIAQLGDRRVEGVVDFGRRTPVQGVLGVAEIQPDRHQPLLGTVVEVAGQSAAFLVGDRDDPRPGGVELLQPPPQLDLQGRDLQGESARARTSTTRRSSVSRCWTSVIDLLPGVDGGDPSTGRGCQVQRPALDVVGRASGRSQYQVPSPHGRAHRLLDAVGARARPAGAGPRSRSSPAGTRTWPAGTDGPPGPGSGSRTGRNATATTSARGCGGHRRGDEHPHGQHDAAYTAPSTPVSAPYSDRPLITSRCRRDAAGRWPRTPRSAGAPAPAQARTWMEASRPQRGRVGSTTATSAPASSTHLNCWRSRPRARRKRSSSATTEAASECR